jgi:hypothetical protein
MEFPPFQSRQEVVIHAPLQAVWEFKVLYPSLRVGEKRKKGKKES